MMEYMKRSYICTAQIEIHERYRSWQLSSCEESLKVLNEARTHGHAISLVTSDFAFYHVIDRRINEHEICSYISSVEIETTESWRSLFFLSGFLSKCLLIEMLLSCYDLQLSCLLASRVKVGQ